MRSKKAALALLLIIPFFVTACSLRDLPLIGKFFGGGDGGGNTEEPVTLNFWSLWEKPEVMEELITQYKQDHPNITINFDDRTIVNVNDYKEAVFTRASQEGSFDIVLVHNSWVPRLRNVLVPSKNIDSTFVAENMYPTASESGVYNGEVYAVPMYYDGLALIYNKAHFNEIDQMYPPTAWEEFRKLAMQLTVFSEGRDRELIRAGAALGCASNIDFFSDILGLMFVQALTDVPEDLDSKYAADALQFYVNFVLEDEVWSENMPESATAFAQEKVSMIFAPSWIVLDILKERPDLDIGVAKVPQALTEKDSDKYTSWATYWMAAVPVGSQYQQQAWEFIKYLTEEETQLVYYNAAAKYREFGPVYSKVGLADQIAPGHFLEPYVKDALIARSGSIAARAGNKDQVTAMKEAVDAVLHQGVSPLDALTAAKDKILKSQ
ncbi:extracellular solute-binding protein [Patescibacteria group bacterium]|nr:extracellular solute-binding protein [Patescibacteria group bacterium]